MFATFTDWSMDNPEEGSKTAKAMWPDAETAQKSIDTMRAKGASMSGAEMIGGAMGTVLLDMD